MRTLLAHGADWTRTTKQGAGPITFARQTDNEEVVKILEVGLWPSLPNVLRVRLAAWPWS